MWKKCDGYNISEINLTASISNINLHLDILLDNPSVNDHKDNITLFKSPINNHMQFKDRNKLPQENSQEIQKNQISKFKLRG